MKAMRLVLAILLPLFAVPVHAAEDARGGYDRVYFQVHAGEAVDNDLMRVELAAEAQAENPAAVAKAINEAMQWAVAEARRVKGVDVRTGGYHTRPVYLKGELKHWRGVQRLILSSGDRKRLTGLLGVLQQRLAVQSVGFMVAENTREALVERLTGEAIRAYQARAGQIAADFGAKGYRLVNVSINTGRPGGGPVPLRVQAMSAGEAVPPPAMEAGSSRVVVTVSGTIELER